ncbi:DNA cytosine methyltransferase [Streptomyces sp. ADI97-07]|uniref:DNA cytosine methyltransferase n=1 Tax=Streptomyces sp. ADI97-07 TaxID=1522762 RepID=UPI001F14C1E7|nr:DNA cytosine methyltransferase [Streptomyces sp. ADI97-07]
MRGTRSGVWTNVLDSVRVIRPRLLFLENVSNIRTRGLEVVLGDLASIGYDARYMCVRATAARAPHLRDRWFCIATPEDADLPRTSAVTAVLATPRSAGGAGTAPRSTTKPATSFRTQSRSSKAESPSPRLPAPTPPLTGGASACPASGSGRRSPTAPLRPPHRG